MSISYATYMVGQGILYTGAMLALVWLVVPALVAFTGATWGGTRRFEGLL